MTLPGYSTFDLGVIRKRDALTGLRQWSRDDSGLLRGVYGKTWKPGPHRADCDVLRHQHPRYEIPFMECWCGFWGAYTEDIFHEFHMGEKPVVGIMKGWGHVVSGERGFRAERAEIIGLHLAYEYVKLKPADPPRDESGVNLRFSTDYDQKGTPECAAKLAEDEVALQERYPGVPFYPSVNALLEAHPIKKKKGA